MEYAIHTNQIYNEPCDADQTPYHDEHWKYQLMREVPWTYSHCSLPCHNSKFCPTLRFFFSLVSLR